MSVRKDRMKKFVIDLAAYCYHPAVERMSQQQRGALLFLLYAMWQMPEPGVIQVEGNDRALRRYTDTPGEEWAATRAALESVFDTESRPGFWIDRLMVASHDSQTEYSKERSRSGTKGAEARWGSHGSANSSAHGSAMQGADGTTDGGTGSGAGSGAENRRESRVPRSFTHPTLDEVKAYCGERRRGVDSQAWYDHYEANGWRVGKNPMQDWRASVRRWERNGVGVGMAIPNDRPSGPHPALEKIKRQREEWEQAQASNESNAGPRGPV
jgi:uncharacterized protein YdaU (DUF1376 family)